MSRAMILAMAVFLILVAMIINLKLEAIFGGTAMVGICDVTWSVGDGSVAMWGDATSCAINRNGVVQFTDPETRRTVYISGNYKVTRRWPLDDR